jgi:hypothetical protein
VTLLNIGNGGVPKKYLSVLGAHFFVGSGGSFFCHSVLGAQYFGCSGGSHFTLTFFFFQFLVGALKVGLFYLLYIADLFYFVCTGLFCVSLA